MRNRVAAIIYVSTVLVHQFQIPFRVQTEAQTHHIIVHERIQWKCQLRTWTTRLYY